MWMKQASKARTRGELPRERIISSPPIVRIERLPYRHNRRARDRGFRLHGPDLPALFVQERYHPRSEEHTSELQSLMRISYAVFCLNKKRLTTRIPHNSAILSTSIHTLHNSLITNTQ